MPFEVSTGYSKGKTGVKKTRSAVADEFAESTAFYKDLDAAQRKVFFGTEKLENGPIGEGLKQNLEAAGITRFTNEDGTIDYEGVIEEFKRQWTDYERGGEILKERSDYDEARAKAYVEEMERVEAAEREAMDQISAEEAAARDEAEKSGIMFSRSGIFTGSGADYANRSRQGGKDDGPSIVHIGKQNGIAFGWGLYGSTSKSDGENFGRHVYEQTFFTNREPGDESHLIEWDKPLSQENKDRILDGLVYKARHNRHLKEAIERNLAQEAADFGLDKSEDYVREEVEYMADDVLRDAIERTVDVSDNGRSVYKHLAALLSGKSIGESNAFANRNETYKRASEFLRNECDIDGIKYPAEADGAKAGETHYVSFRDDNIRVDHKWRDGQLLFSRATNKAPNGNKSNLDERQQGQVRSREFKKWFGDWERDAELDAARDFVLNGKAVARLTGTEFAKDGTSLVARVARLFEQQGGEAINPDLGRVELNSKGVKSSMAHGIGVDKAAAFAAVKDVIEKGRVFDRNANWKDRNYDTAVIAAPIAIGQNDYVCEVVVKLAKEKNSFYLHEVNLKKSLSDTIKTPTGGVSIGESARPVRSIIAQRLAERKGGETSKVVDANGEPLVVYRGSEYDPLSQEPGKGVIKPEAYFTADPNYARRYKGENGAVRAYYLNIKKPFDIRNPECLKDFESVYPGVKLARGKSGALDWAEAATVDAEFLKENFGDKYDGIIYDEASDWAPEGNLPKWRGLSYVPLDGGAQVKSATDNIGTFDPGNNDIRFSRGAAPEAEYVKLTRVADDAGAGERTPGALAASAELSRTKPTPITTKGTRYVALPVSEMAALARYLNVGHAQLLRQEAPGGVSLKHKKLWIAADVLGTVDKTDMAAEKEILKRHGFFQQEDPGWLATHSPTEARRERFRSEDALSARLEALADRRIAGKEPGGFAAGRKVFADQLAKVVMSMPHGQPGVLGAMQTVGGALQKRVRGDEAEADAFIGWMKGETTPPARSAQERKAEMFAAFLMMPQQNLSSAESSPAAELTMRSRA